VTLQYLAGRHRLILVTKGDFAEQSGKIERSGLKQYFSAVEVVADKTIPAYHEVVGKHKLASQSTWMVGNSPKSDINPALCAGINAVFVPHDDTWILEHEDLAPALPPRRLLVLTAFAELTQHF
jgi:putative hydrolase of the HAD superfamily